MKLFYSLLSVVSLVVLAGDFFPEPLLTDVPDFLSFPEFSLFFLGMAGELLACETSEATPITVTDEGSTKVLSDSYIMAF